MAYPERGASYKHEPKFIERMKHAEGGKCGPYRQAGGGLTEHGWKEEGPGDDLSKAPTSFAPPGPTWANDPKNPASSAYRPPTEHGWIEEGPGDDMTNAPTTKGD
jgi:hypothetical protein